MEYIIRQVPPQKADMTINYKALSDLADFLENNYADIRETFDMENYAEASPDDYNIRAGQVELDYPTQTEVNLKHCGSVGCAVGHNTFLTPINLNEDWNHYQVRCFGIHPFDDHDVWEYLFSSEWANTDQSSPKDAAYRLRYFVEHKAVEPDYEESWL